VQSMVRTKLTVTSRLTVINDYFCNAHMSKCMPIKRQLGVAACAVLYHDPALRETSQYRQRPVRDDFLERRIAGRHSLRLHDGDGYFGRRERPRR
jgi:hypothetical protein